ncbi:MAG: hypothetical protein WC045_03180 [Patescibacteria group bacterium]
MKNEDKESVIEWLQVFGWGVLALSLFLFIGFIYALRVYPGTASVFYLIFPIAGFACLIDYAVLFLIRTQYSQGRKYLLIPGILFVLITLVLILAFAAGPLIGLL